jgi:hypothetical protein
MRAAQRTEKEPAASGAATFDDLQGLLRGP